VVARTIAEFGKIDILVNNAGKGMVAPFEFVQMPDAIELFEVNFFGVFMPSRLSCRISRNDARA